MAKKQQKPGWGLQHGTPRMICGVGMVRDVTGMEVTEPLDFIYFVLCIRFRITEATYVVYCLKYVVTSLLFLMGYHFDTQLEQLLKRM